MRFSAEFGMVAILGQLLKNNSMSVKVVTACVKTIIRWSSCSSASAPCRYHLKVIDKF